jgi:hypothetical protein
VLFQNGHQFSIRPRLPDALDRCDLRTWEHILSFLPTFSACTFMLVSKPASSVVLHHLSSPRKLRTAITRDCQTIPQGRKLNSGDVRNELQKVHNSVVAVVFRLQHEAEAKTVKTQAYNAFSYLGGTVQHISTCITEIRLRGAADQIWTTWLNWRLNLPYFVKSAVLLDMQFVRENWPFPRFAILPTPALIRRDDSSDDLIQRAAFPRKPKLLRSIGTVRTPPNATFDRPSWQHDSEAPQCTSCAKTFGWFVRKHHCRACGLIFCGACSNQKLPLPYLNGLGRVCLACWVELHNHPEVCQPSVLPVCPPSSC